jgi:ascorbate-specific PTS system EIIC-type component UlaA
MIRYVHNSKLPKWLKILIYITLTITCIYWLGIFIYKVLEYTRRFIHWTTEKRNWWTFLVCILILLIGSLIMAQGVLGLDPLGRFEEFLLEQWESIKEGIVSIWG